MSGEAELLKKRARLYAQPPACSDMPGGDLIAVFRIGGSRYGFGIKHVNCIKPLDRFAPLPCSPPFVYGIANLRGRICPLIDVKKVVEGEGIEGKARYMVVLEADGVKVGVPADEIVGIFPKPRELKSCDSEFVEGMSDDGTIVVNVESFLRSEAIIVSEEV